jgi:hypothetical protein
MYLGPTYNLPSYLAGKPKNVMALTTTVPLLGVTKDDLKRKPAPFRRYDYR